jgi:putative membrane protein
MLAATHPLHWQPHPEVWLLVASVVALGLYVTRVIQPKMVAVGEAPVSRRQKAFFVLGVLLLWLASDWPVHDVAEEYHYSVHMVQHLVLTYVMPPVFLFATPAWLVRLVLGSGAIGRFVQRLGRPLVAAIGFNAILALTHAAWIVNTSVRVGPFHYLVHVSLVLAAFLMWMPVCGPVPELRLSLPVQMGYIFLMSVLPTVPAAFLTVAENPLYRAYDGPFRMWGVGVIQDQQAAGLIMKLGGGFYLWTIITVLFFKWSARQLAAERPSRLVTEPDVLTFEHVQAEFDKVGSPPADVKPEAAN